MVKRCGAASRDRTFIHRAAFSKGERRQRGTFRTFTMEALNPLLRHDFAKTAIHA